MWPETFGTTLVQTRPTHWQYNITRCDNNNNKFLYGEVMAVTVHIAAAAQIDPSYSSGSAGVHLIWYIAPYRSAPNDTLIGSSVFAELTVVTYNIQMHR